MRFSSYAQALSWLESHIDFERLAPNHQLVPSLEPIRELFVQFADPHHDYPTIHITGTNGKGTTTTLTSALLRATGLRVGTFTSPDLHAVNERIALNGEAIDDETFIALMERLSDAETVSGIVLTRFELLTVGAFLHFSDEGVDVGVIEVGLGGTWDSTNVIDSDVAVLTNVDLDHTAVLGPTVGAIASDKVGIFRHDAINVIATTNAIVVEIAEEKTRELDATLWRIGEEFELRENELALGGRAISLRTPYAEYEDVFVSLHGIHQGVNAATAIVVAEAFLGRALGEDVVTTTMASARHARTHGSHRAQPAHRRRRRAQPRGRARLVATLDGAFDVSGERRCVLGMLTGRDLDDMVTPLIGASFTEFYCCAPNSPRAVPASELVRVLQRHGAIAYEHPNSRAALAHARERSNDDDLIIVAGSLYLVAEVRGEVLRIPSRHLS